MSLTTLMGAGHLLWKTGKSLGLDNIDRLKYALSVFLRRESLAALAPAYFIVKLPCGTQALIRPNAIDRNTLLDIFGSRIYQLRASGLKHVLDLGSNVGIATLFFASQFPDAEFACVEPLPGNQSVLKEAVRINRIRATIFEGAVGITSGEAELNIGCEPDMCSLTPVQPSSQKLRVRQFAVSEILDTLGWDHVDLLKVDIEGYEKVLLHENTAWLSRVNRIIGEAHGHVSYGIDNVRADLEPLGFQVELKSFDPRFGLTIFEASRP